MPIISDLTMAKGVNINGAELDFRHVMQVRPLLEELFDSSTYHIQATFYLVDKLWLILLLG